MSCHYQHIDPQLLLKTVDGNAHVCAQLMTTFIETAPAIFARLMDAMKEGNAEWVWHESHALKGMAMLIGAQSFSDALQAMEKQAREKIVDNTQQNLLSLEAGFEKVLEEVGSYVQSLSATHPPSEK